MNNPKLSGRYAKALFDYAGEKNQVEEVYHDLQLFANTLKENRELQVLLRNPVIEANQKHKVFESIFNGTLHDTTYQFLEVLLKKKREPALDTICDEYFRLYNAAHNIHPVTITTASPLSEQMKKRVLAILSEQIDGTVSLQELVSPDLIGGFVIKMDDYYFDSSILSKINKLRQEFSQNNFQVSF